MYTLHLNNVTQSNSIKFFNSKNKAKQIQPVTQRLQKKKLTSLDGQIHKTNVKNRGLNINKITFKWLFILCFYLYNVSNRIHLYMLQFLRWWFLKECHSTHGMLISALNSYLHKLTSDLLQERHLYPFQIQSSLSVLSPTGKILKYLKKILTKEYSESEQMMQYKSFIHTTDSKNLKDHVFIILFYKILLITHNITYG